MQLSLLTIDKIQDQANFSDPNFASNKLKPIHRWVPWIAGFSSAFVSNILRQHLPKKGTVLDPFCGVGTTLVEAALAGHDVIGFEINPYAALACRVKVAAGEIDLEHLKETCRQLREFYDHASRNENKPISIPPEKFKTRVPFYSPLILKKVLIVQDFINGLSNLQMTDIVKLVFAATMVSYSNYSYEPSLGTRRAAGKGDMEDFNVIDHLLLKLQEMIKDIENLPTIARNESRIINHSFFRCTDHIKAKSVDLCITSPPYLNNYHYIRNTRPQLYWLGFVQKPSDTEFLEQENFGKYWQTVRDKETIALDVPDPPAALVKQLQQLRVTKNERGIYGGQGWANYAASYFNDCYRFAKNLQYSLKKDAQAFVVIGNSILQGLMIPTDHYLGAIAKHAGFKVVDIHVLRSTRVGNSIIQSDVRVEKAQNSHQLYESVVHLIKK